MSAFFSALYAHVVWPLRDRVDASREDGLEAVEYALIAALLAAIVVLAVTSFRQPLLDAYQAIANQLTTAGGTINTPN
jgi:Flp pilus assembly pilin Flp